MKPALKKIYHDVKVKFPALGNLIWRVYNKKPFNTISRKISGSGNRIQHRGAILSKVRFEIQGSGNEIIIKPGCILRGVRFFILGNGHKIEIGENCRFNLGGCLWLEDSECSLIIGDRSSFVDVHLAVTEPKSQIRIGSDCLFAYDIDVRTGDSHALMDAATGKKINSARNVLISNHVWVAAHCVILKGVAIQEDSVVATGSVVTKCCDEKGVVLAGNPAGIVKRGVTWSNKRYVD